MDNSSVDQRLRRLERTNTLLVALLATTALLATVGWSTGAQAISSVVKTNELQVYSKDGKMLARIGYDDYSKGGSITLNEKGGERRSWWRVGPTNASLVLTGSAGRNDADIVLGVSQSGKHVRMQMGGYTDGLAYMAIQDRKPEIRLWDATGKETFRAPAKTVSK